MSGLFPNVIENPLKKKIRPENLDKEFLGRFFSKNS